jgi:hypothetical protein
LSRKSVQGYEESIDEIIILREAEETFLKLNATDLLSVSGSVEILDHCKVEQGRIRNIMGLNRKVLTQEFDTE